MKFLSGICRQSADRLISDCCFSRNNLKPLTQDHPSCLHHLSAAAGQETVRGSISNDSWSLPLLWLHHAPPLVLRVFSFCLSLMGLSCKEIKKMPVKFANLTPYSDKNTHIKTLYITHIYSSTQSFIPGGVEVPSCFRGTACRTAKGTTSSSGEKMRNYKRRNQIYKPSTHIKKTNKEASKTGWCEQKNTEKPLLQWPSWRPFFYLNYVAFRIVTLQQQKLFSIFPSSWQIVLDLESLLVSEASSYCMTYNNQSCLSSDQKPTCCHVIMYSFYEDSSPGKCWGQEYRTTW